MLSTPRQFFLIIAKGRTGTQNRSDDQEPENRNKTETSHLAVHSARWLVAFVFSPVCLTGGGSCENSSCGLRLPAQSLKQLFVNRFQQLRVVIVVVKEGKHLRNQCIMGFRILLPQLFQQAAFLRADALCLEPEADPGPASPGVDDEGISAGEVHTDAGVVAAGGLFIGIGNSGELIPAPVEISVDSYLAQPQKISRPWFTGLSRKRLSQCPWGQQHT